jgi:hypothetical protein
VGGEDGVIGGEGALIQIKHLPHRSIFLENDILHCILSV